VTADPLWPVVLVLAEIAERVEREQANDRVVVPHVGLRADDGSGLGDYRRDANQDAGEPEEAT
jgi:hypothetical protein